MKTIGLVAVSICLAVVVAQEPNVELDVDLENMYGRPGDNVTFNCRASHLQDTDTIFWFKMVHEGDNKNAEVIAANDNKIPPYSGLARYHTVPPVVMSDITTLFTMHIYGLDAHDTGHVGCSYGKVDQEIYSVKDLLVYQEPKTIEFVVNNQTDVKNITMRQGDKVAVSCVVHEIMPYPKFVITLGDRVLTDSFMQVSEVKVHCKDSSCPVYFNYDVTMKTHDLAAAPEDNGHLLTCRSEMVRHEESTEPMGRRRRHQGGNHTVITTQVPVYIIHAPVVHCASEQKAKLSDKVQIRCRVNANPAVNESMWHFKFGGTEHTIDGSGIEPYAEAGISSGINGDEYYLEIKSVQLKHFGTYDFHVINAEGEGRGKTTLVREVATESPIAGASGLFTIRTVALLVMLLLFAH